MKSQYIKEIFKSFINEDKQKFLEFANAIISDEKKLNHQLFANELKDIIKKADKLNIVQEVDYNKSYKKNIPIPRDNEKGFPLLELKEFELNWDDLIVNEDIKTHLHSIEKGFWNKEILSSYGIKPKQKVLFYGVPGTGKTLTAKILSNVLGFPLVYVRFDAIVSSYLGETATNLKKIFDFIEKGQWVVLLDEFDVVGKQRDDQYEHGEIKRVVNNFMQLLDSFDGESLIIAATNHEQLLDSGLWRRFDDIIHFELPNENERERLFQFYFKPIKKVKMDNVKLASMSAGLSAADISQIVSESIRQMIIENKTDISIELITAVIDMFLKRKKLEPNKI
ncbi:MAG: ATP-binding protein [Mariniphaga sp.]